MTDLEREAAEIVRAIVEAACEATTEACYDPLQHERVEKEEFVARIVALAREHGFAAKAWALGVPLRGPRTTELL